jgi:hypothetical protein
MIDDARMWREIAVGGLIAYVLMVVMWGAAYAAWRITDAYAQAVEAENRTLKLVIAYDAARASRDNVAPSNAD